MKTAGRIELEMEMVNDDEPTAALGLFGGAAERGTYKRVPFAHVVKYCM